ncbi:MULTISPECIES: hypothetical protein [Bacillus]|uniref:hypothetical protein n=1 Tax=Bacillus TaxID=1386 RepID=UPI000BB6A355|nr:MULTISPECIES: hypothetical protein [Bacillus]
MDIRFYDGTNSRKKRNSIEEDFESQLSAATAIFAYFLFKDKSKENISQININCISNIDTFKFYEVIDGFWDIDVPYDPNKFLSIKEDDLKRKEFRSIFGEIFEEVFTYKNWDKGDLEIALLNSEKVGFKREFLLKGTPQKNQKKISFQ